MADGVIYFATGEDFLEEAKRSATSLKAASDVHVTLFTDRDVVDDVFDAVETVDTTDNPFLDKVEALKRTPYDRTVFLDTDTYVCEDISALFEVLDRFDIAAAYTPGHAAPDREGSEDIPDTFPEMNTGVLAYRNTGNVLAMIQAWKERYEERVSEGFEGNDQMFIQEVLYNSDLDIGVLPPEYNYRFAFPGAVEGKVKILHGRDNRTQTMVEYNKLAKVFNSETSLRAYTGNNNRRIITDQVLKASKSYPSPGRYRRAFLSLLRTIWREGAGSGIASVKNALIKR